MPGSHMINNLDRILFSAEQIALRVGELGAQITRDYEQAGVSEITIICITNGGIIFTADLARQIRLQTRIDCMRISSYNNKDTSSGSPEIIGNLRLNVSHTHVLIIDDILDTGRTITALVKKLESVEVASIKTCMFLDKRACRELSFTADYTGFDIADEFVVGYGLDFAEHYRNLPCVGVLKSEFQ